MKQYSCVEICDPYGHDNRVKGFITSSNDHFSFYNVSYEDDFNFNSFNFNKFISVIHCKRDRV